MKGRELRAFLVERDGPHCHWCGRLTADPLDVGPTADEAQTVDHLDTPKPRRSVRDPARALVACSRCNQDRGSLTETEWRAVLKVRELSAPRYPRRPGFYVVLVVTVIWWGPSLLLAAAALAADRAQFGLTLLLVDVLKACGRRDAARRVCEAALARSRRRVAKLAERRGW